MNWEHWHKGYNVEPSMQARLQLVREQAGRRLQEHPPGPFQIISICSGDSRDLLGLLRQHPRREEVTAWLLDTDRDSLDRGRTAAEKAGLARQCHFIQADAASARSYLEKIPADLVLISGVFGHLRPADVACLIDALPMLCRPGGHVIWNRHLVHNDGGAQMPVIREWFRSAGFEEVEFQTTAPDGYAVGCARFTGAMQPLELSRVFFEFVGVDRLTGAQPPVRKRRKSWWRRLASLFRR
jgi:SAM-dependent methyltransferase